MKAKTNFASNCSVCHGLDDETTIFDASNPEAIRTCQRCHTKETLHAVHRQESHGWEAVGFHVAENSDGIPDSFRVFTGNQMCIGCHGEVPAIPEIRRLKPRSIRPLMVLKIVGNNFGSSQGDSTIHIGNQIFDNTSSRIKFWSNTKVKLRMPNYKTQWYKGKDSRRKKVRVTVNGIESNEKALKVFKPCDCDLNGDGVCDSVDSELLAAEMNRTDCSEPGFKCKGDLNSDGAVDGSDADLFMDFFERTDCQQL
jgi:hypothetical protein